VRVDPASTPSVRVRALSQAQTELMLGELERRAREATSGRGEGRGDGRMLDTQTHAHARLDTQTHARHAWRTRTHAYRVDGSRVTLEGGQQGPTVTVPHEDLRVHKSTQEHGGVRRRHAKKSEARSRGSWHVSWYVGSRHVGRHGEMST